jgi:hypothetical protein
VSEPKARITAEAVSVITRSLLSDRILEPGLLIPLSLRGFLLGDPARLPDLEPVARCPVPHWHPDSDFGWPLHLLLRAAAEAAQAADKLVTPKDEIWIGLIDAHGRDVRC